MRNTFKGLSKFNIKMNEYDTPLVVPPSMPDSRQSKTDLIIEQFRKWDPNNHVSFKGHTSDVWSCAISSDNSSIFSGSTDGTIIAWTAEGSQKYSLQGHKHNVGVLLLTRNQKMISADWESNIFLWDLKNQQLLKEIKGNSNKLYTAALSPCGNLVGTCGAGPVLDLWDAHELNHIGSINLDSQLSLSIIFNRLSSVVVVSCSGGLVKTFNTKTLALEKTCQPDQASRDEIQALALAYEDRLLIVGYKRTNLIRVLNFKDFSEFHVFDYFKKSVRGIIVTNDSKYFIAYSADQSIKIFDILGKSLEWKIDGSEGFLFSGCLSKDNTVLICGSSDNTLRKWTLGSKNRLKVRKVHQSAILTMAITSDDSFMATGGEDNLIKLVNLQDFSDVSELVSHQSKVWALKFTPDDQLLGSGSEDKTIKIWNFREKTVKLTLAGHLMGVFCLSFSPDSCFLVSGSQDTFINLYEVGTGNLAKSWKAHTDSITSVEVSKDGQFIVSGSSDYSVKIWQLQTGSLVHKIWSDYNEIDSIAFSPNGENISFGYKNGMIRLYKWPADPFNFSLTKIASFAKHADRVKDVAFSPDNSFLISCSYDKTIRVWNVNEYTEEFSFCQNSEIRKVLFNSQNSQIFSADKTGKVYFWDVQSTEIMDLADIRNPIDTYLFLSTVKTSNQINPKHINFKFGEARINLAHFYSILGKDKLLIAALRAGTEIKRDIDGNSPLFYALSRKSQSCVDKILKYLHELKMTDLGRFLKYSYQIRDDFEILIKNYSVRLPEFLDDVFYSVPISNSFGFPRQSLPIISYSDSKIVDPFVFIENNPSDASKANEVNFQLLTLPFTIPCELGSESSLNFLERINSCSNPRIMQTHFIQTYIKHKWDAVWYIILLQVMILALIETVMILLVIDYHYPSTSVHEPNYWLQSFFIFLNVLQGVYELIQAFALGLSYFSFWNCIDMARLALSLTWSACCFFWPLSQMHVLTFFMVVFNLIRGLTCFRVVNKARHYVRLVKSAMADSFFFLLIFFYSTLSFGVLYFISNDSEPDVFSIWRASYELNMGDISRANSENVATYIYFFLASVINVIIMLNLLISILGDTFDSFQLNADQMDYFEMAELVTEIESLMFWKRNCNNKKFIQVCEEVFGHEDQQWAGKVKQVLDVVRKLKKDTQIQSLEMNRKLDLILEKVQGSKGK